MTTPGRRRRRLEHGATMPRFTCRDCGAAFSGLLRGDRGDLAPSNACALCTELRTTEEREDRLHRRIIAIEIGVALALTVALIIAWFLAASPASAGAHRDTSHLGADGYVTEAALRAALARLRLDSGAGSVGVRWADGGATAVARDAGLRASRSDGGAR